MIIKSNKVEKVSLYLFIVGVLFLGSVFYHTKLKKKVFMEKKP
jgi:hypothetical protein